MEGDESRARLFLPPPHFLSTTHINNNNNLLHHRALPHKDQLNMPSLKEITSPIANELLGTSGTIVAGSRVVGGDNKSKPTTTTSSSQDDDDLKYIGTSTLDEQLAKKKKDAVDLCDSDTGTKPTPVDHQLEKRLGIESKGGGKKSGSSTMDNSPKKIKVEGGTKKKRKKSILEQMNIIDDDGIDEKGIDEVEKENSKNKSTTKKAKKKKSDSTSKSKDIRNFYSLSPKEEQQKDSKSPMSSGKSSEEDVTPTKKKRKSTKVVSLNENAKPIHLHIPFIGEGEMHTFSINAHCVDIKYDVSSEPIVLKGKQYCRAKGQIKNFLSGFGRYIH